MSVYDKIFKINCKYLYIITAIGVGKMELNLEMFLYFM